MNALVALYIGLLLLGIGCFVMHYVSLLQLARRLQRQHPQQWKIVTETDGVRSSLPSLWVRMLQVARSPALAAMQDPVVDRWVRLWRLTPWLAWACWLGALILQWKAR